MGDYYAGDPGLVSFFTKAAGALVRGVGRLFGGGRIITGVPTFPERAAAAAGVAIARRAPGRVIQAGGQIIRAGGRAIARHPVLSAAGAAGAIGAIGGAAGAGVGAEAPMRGFHISRRTGALVRNRRMRVTNPRALRRAIRRATGFARLARRVLYFTSPKRPKGRALFKARRAKMS